MIRNQSLYFVCLENENNVNAATFDANRKIFARRTWQKRQIHDIVCSTRLTASCF